MTTPTDFLSSMSASLHEARFVVAETVTAKSALIATWATQHSSELLYGSLSVLAVSVMCLLGYKLFKANTAVENLKLKNTWLETSRDSWMDSWARMCSRKRAVEAAYNDLDKTNDSLREDNVFLKAKGANLKDGLTTAINTIGALRDELHEAHSRVEDLESDVDRLTEDRDEWRENSFSWENSCDSARERVEELEEELDDLESDNRTLRMENTELRSLVDNYKELTAMNDAQFAQAA